MRVLFAAALLSLGPAAEAGIVSRRAVVRFEGVPKWHIASGPRYHFAYLAEVGEEEYWFIDGKKRGAVRRGSVVRSGISGGPSATVDISDDGTRLAFVQDVFDDKGKHLGVAVSVNGVLGSPYDAVTNLMLHDEGGSVAYVAEKGGRYRVVLDGTEGPATVSSPQELAFADRKVALAYLQEFDNRWTLMLNHKRIQPWPSMNIAYGRDLERLAATTREGIAGWQAEVDGKRLGRVYLNHIGGMTFSPDGRRFGFLGQDTDAGPIQVVLDGAEVGAKLEYPGHNDWPTIQFSSKGSRVFWFAKTGGGWRLFIDGKPQEGAWERIHGWSRVALSPSGGHYAFLASKGGRQYLVIDGEPEAVAAIEFYANSGLRFDNEEEFHFLQGVTDGVSLVCGAVSKEPKSDVCPRTSRRLFPNKEE